MQIDSGPLLTSHTTPSDLWSLTFCRRPYKKLLEWDSRFGGIGKLYPVRDRPEASGVLPERVEDPNLQWEQSIRLALQILNMT